MSLTLSLLRHAHAVDHHPSGDLYRPLSDHGIQQCKQLAYKLRQDQISLPVCISSHAVRTLTTITTVLNILGYDHQCIQCETVLYDGGIKDLVGLVQSLPADHHNILLVGHNNELSELGVWLTGDHNLRLHKSEYVHITVDVSDRSQIVSKSGQIVLQYRQRSKGIDRNP